MNTFNQKIKDKLLKTGGNEKNCCKTACLCALICTSGSIVLTKDGINIEITGDNEKLFVKIAELCKVAGDFDIYKKVSGSFGKTDFTALIPAPYAAEILKMCFILKTDDSGGTEITENLDGRLFLDNACSSSFIKGATLGSGYCLIPDSAESKSKGYLMEWIFERGSIALDFIKILNDLGAYPKYTKRKEKTVVYLKDSEQICDILALIGAGNAVLEIQTQKAERNMKNRIIRETNCINRNIQKTVEAAERAVKAIEKLEAEGRLDKLPEKLKATALLRKNNPHLALDELALLSGEPISKSGLRHRLDKIIEIYESTN